jgi:hypothetical protein
LQFKLHAMLLLILFQMELNSHKVKSIFHQIINQSIDPH